MHHQYTINLIFSLLIFSSFTNSGKAGLLENELDVISYNLTIEPDFYKGSIEGMVMIKFQIDPIVNFITLKAGDLLIDKVTGESVIEFKKTGQTLIIDLSEREKNENEIIINYHGNPKTGLFFHSAPAYVYTVYSTSHWMVCNDLPSDKAILSLNIIAPKGKKCVASGELIEIQEKEEKTLFQWHQNYETPAYTYGFAIGNFNKTEEKSEAVLLEYFSENYSPEELSSIFKDTQNMLSFFEEKSGIEYYQTTYSQILIGDHYQEMSGFSVLKNIYGNMVLKDSTETNLISHELAHQWWGNRITCKRWSHFWLNEAFATYMSAAFNEYRFGKNKYLSDINAYLKVYEDIKKRDNDKPLVFRNWVNPSRDDRNLVYFKGAYVLHLLREEMGSESFWKGIKFYSQKYFGRSVETIDFQKAMEESSGENLQTFFDKWVY